MKENDPLKSWFKKKSNREAETILEPPAKRRRGSEITIVMDHAAFDPVPSNVNWDFLSAESHSSIFTPLEIPTPTGSFDFVDPSYLGRVFSQVRSKSQDFDSSSQHPLSQLSSFGSQRSQYQCTSPKSQFSQQNSFGSTSSRYNSKAQHPFLRRLNSSQRYSQQGPPPRLQSVVEKEETYDEGTASPLHPSNSGFARQISKSSAGSTDISNCRCICSVSIPQSPLLHPVTRLKSVSRSSSETDTICANTPDSSADEPIPTEDAPLNPSHSSSTHLPSSRCNSALIRTAVKESGTLKEESSLSPSRIIVTSSTILRRTFVPSTSSAVKKTNMNFYDITTVPTSSNSCHNDSSTKTLHFIDKLKVLPHTILGQTEIETRLLEDPFPVMWKSTPTNGRRSRRSPTQHHHVNSRLTSARLPAPPSPINLTHETLIPNIISKTVFGSRSPQLPKYPSQTESQQNPLYSKLRTLPTVVVDPTSSQLSTYAKSPVVAEPFTHPCNDAVPDFPTSLEKEQSKCHLVGVDKASESSETEEDDCSPTQNQLSQSPLLSTSKRSMSHPKPVQQHNGTVGGDSSVISPSVDKIFGTYEPDDSNRSLHMCSLTSSNCGPGRRAANVDRSCIQLDRLPASPSGRNTLARSNIKCACEEETVANSYSSLQQETYSLPETNRIHIQQESLRHPCREQPFAEITSKIWQRAKLGLGFFGDKGRLLTKSRHRDGSQSFESSSDFSSLSNTSVRYEDANWNTPCESGGLNVIKETTSLSAMGVIPKSDPASSEPSITNPSAKWSGNFTPLRSSGLPPRLLQTSQRVQRNDSTETLQNNIGGALTPVPLSLLPSKEKPMTPPFSCRPVTVSRCPLQFVRLHKSHNNKKSYEPSQSSQPHIPDFAESRLRASQTFQKQKTPFNWLLYEAKLKVAPMDNSSSGSSLSSRYGRLPQQEMSQDRQSPFQATDLLTLQNSSPLSSRRYSGNSATDHFVRPSSSSNGSSELPSNYSRSTLQFSEVQQLCIKNQLRSDNRCIVQNTDRKSRNLQHASALAFTNHPKI